MELSECFKSIGLRMNNTKTYAKGMLTTIGEMEKLIDMIREDSSAKDAQITELTKQLALARNDVKIADSGIKEYPVPTRGYDQRDELDTDGRKHPYIIPIKGGLCRYTRSMFEFLNFCSKVLCNCGLQNASYRDQLQGMVDAGIPIECIVHVCRKPMSDVMSILIKHESDVYPYMRAIWKTYFNNPEADWHCKKTTTTHHSEDAEIKRIFAEDTNPHNGANLADSRSKGHYPVKVADAASNQKVIELIKSKSPIKDINVFKEIRSEAGVTNAEMMGVFNCDVRMFSNNMTRGVISQKLADAINNVIGEVVVIASVDKRTKGTMEKIIGVPLGTDDYVGVSIEKNTDKDIGSITTNPSTSPRKGKLQLDPIPFDVAVAILKPNSPHTFDEAKTIVRGSEYKGCQWTKLSGIFTQLIYSKDHGAKFVHMLNELMGFECLRQVSQERIEKTDSDEKPSNDSSNPKKVPGKNDQRINVSQSFDNGTQFANYLIMKKIRQADLARELNVSRQYINFLVTQTKPMTEVKKLVEKMLGVKFNY